MEESIKTKIEEIIEYIISKPVETVTKDDYTILHDEMKDIRFRKSQKDSNERFKQLLAAYIPSGFGSFEG